MKYLSYPIDEQTPTYGNRDQVVFSKAASIQNGDAANNTHIQSTSHVGTHVDMPYHFYEDGQSIDDFPSEFWIFHSVLYLEIEPKGFVVHDELVSVLEQIPHLETYEALIVKTGDGAKRGTSEYWESNTGFHSDLADYFRRKLPKLRLFGFDTISVSSLQNRPMGRAAHLAFLDPAQAIILLEDMDLEPLNPNSQISKLIVAPLRLRGCDGLPCTILAEF